MADSTKVDTVKKSVQKYYYGVGRRKRSSVRAKYTPSNKGIEVYFDGKSAVEYFGKMWYQTIEVFLANVGIRTGKFELFARGGGVTGQAEGARLAMAKAILAQDEGYRPVLRSFGYLTTDNRKVLSKKGGLRKSRKKEQWSKR